MSSAAVPPVTTIASGVHRAGSIGSSPPVGAAIARLQARGESLQTIAALADMSVAEVRAFLKHAPPQSVSASDTDVARPHRLGGRGGIGEVGGMVEDLARAASIGDLPAAYAVGEQLSVDVTVAAAA
jgi:hypothetical protein